MKKLFKSKKGMKTMVTIFAVLFLLFIFILFIIFFKLAAKNKTGEIELGASSIITENILKNFLKSPAYDYDNIYIKDMTPDVGIGITNADLVSWTCNREEDNYKKNFKALQNSIENYFNGIYFENWELWIIYSDSKRKGFGHKSFLNAVWSGVKDVTARIGSMSPSSPVLQAQSLAFLATYRDPGFGSQVIPCSDGQMAKIMFYSNNQGIKVVRALIGPGII